jgi:hypothetical protein
MFELRKKLQYCSERSGAHMLQWVHLPVQLSLLLRVVVSLTYICPTICDYDLQSFNCQYVYFVREGKKNDGHRPACLSSSSLVSPNHCSQSCSNSFNLWDSIAKGLYPSSKLWMVLIDTIMFH